METIRIDILNPKAKKLLKNLADLDLIKIYKENKKSDFSTFFEQLRTTTDEKLTLEEITSEVEGVRRR